jgi:hypothetical protein
MRWCQYAPFNDGHHQLPGRIVRPFVPLLSEAQIRRLPERARDVVEYRKSGLSLNHIQGCPLGCAYCIRQTTACGIRISHAPS